MFSNKKKQTATQMIRSNFFKYKRYFFEAVLATIIINILTLATSLFSMQVYDRVIPTHGLSTLTTLGIGVVVMIIFEFILKFVRSSIMDNVTYGLDNIYSRNIYKRLLNIKLNKLPTSVGSLSSQLKSYETIRGFLSSSTIFLFVDTPFAILYILLLAFIGSPWLSVVSFTFFMIALFVGLWLKFKIKKHTQEGAKYSNIKVGELVETIQGMEIIKSRNGENKFLSRWMRTSKASIVNDITMKHLNENTVYIAALMQQLGYATIIIIGAYLVVDGAMTMGALIACSIISGRIMAPVAALPGLLSQMSHSKSALEGIEQIYSLQGDFEDVSTPIKPEKISGNYRLSDIEFAYNKNAIALNIKDFEIKAGDKVAILGTIGSGKSTLLKLLTGLYGVDQGRVYVDNLDISHLDREILSKCVGYMPQESRLFQGTLKENLLIGTSNITDEQLKTICEKTGLITMVSTHPQGFEMPIFEGGVGLSVGQRQLVSITRLFLSRPNVWLLDEPTASMDGQLELRTMQLLQHNIKPEDTLVLVTHKPNLLAIVNKILVINNGQIYMYGDKNQVLAQLSQQNITQG